MALEQVNLAHAFNLRVVIGTESHVFPLKRGINWVDASLRETPEWQALISRIELPVEAVQAQLADPQQGLSGGIPINRDLAMKQAKENAERNKELTEQQKQASEQKEKDAKDSPLSLEKVQKEITERQKKQQEAADRAKKSRTQAGAHPAAEKHEPHPAQHAAKK